MRDKTPKPPRPVDGEVVRLSRSSLLFWFSFCALGFCFSVFLAVLALIKLVRFGNWDREQRRAIFIGGAVAFSTGTWIYIQYLHWRADRRVVIGEDRLQLVQTRADRDTVVLQIPYRNIDDLRVTRTDFGIQLEIDLIDLEDPETYLPEGDSTEMMKVKRCHYILADKYRMNVAWIAEEMARAHEPQLEADE